MEPRRGDPDAVVTRVYERGPCLYVEGKVMKRGTWLNAAFTVYKPDVFHMTRDELFAFAKRRLPEVTEDLQWSETGDVLV